MLPTPGAAADAACLSCLNWPGRDPRTVASNCRRWNCLLPWHGWVTRLRHCLKAEKRLPPDADFFTFSILPHRRMNGRDLGRLIRKIRRACLAEPRVFAAVAFPHAGRCDDGPLHPEPDLHLLLMVTRGDLSKEHGMVQLITKTTKRLEGMLRGEFSEVYVSPVLVVENAPAFLRYLYRAEIQHKHMGPEHLPKSGDRYRQVLGWPRRH